MKWQSGRILAGLAVLSLLVAACSDADAGDRGDAGATPTATPTAAPTENTGSGTGGQADDTSMPGPDVQEERPPHLVLWDGATPASLELGTYCWTTMCVDAIGIITTTEVYPVEQGGELRVDGLEAPAPEPELPVTGVHVMAWQLPAEPAGSGEGWQAWQPEGEPVTLLQGENAAFIVDLESGRYLLSVAVTFDGGDASYGAIIDVQ